MIRCRYPTRVVVRDYALAGAGLGCFFAPVVFLNLPLAPQVLFLALSGLFVIFGLQVYRRHRTRIELSDEGLRVAPGGRQLPWRALSKLALAYFAVRRDGERGWMELKLASDAHSVRLDSRLEGFSEIAASAARAAGDNGLELDSATLANLAALGIDPPSRDAARGRG